MSGMNISMVKLQGHGDYKTQKSSYFGEGEGIITGSWLLRSFVASSKITVLTWIIVKMIWALKESIKPYIFVFYYICALKQNNFKESFCGVIQEQVCSLTT